MGYVCSRCLKHRIRLNHVQSVVQVEAGRIVITHSCLCSGDEQFKGRYIIVPDLMFMLFRNRVVKLPYYGMPRRYVREDHPDLVTLRSELATVEGPDDMFPPSVS